LELIKGKILVPSELEKGMPFGPNDRVPSSNSTKEWNPPVNRTTAWEQQEHQWFAKSKGLMFGA